MTALMALKIESLVFVKMEHDSSNLSYNELLATVTLREEGLSYRSVVRRLDVAHATMLRVVQRFREANEYSRRPGQGRHRSTNALQDRFLRIRA